MELKHSPAPWRATFRGMDQDANWASRIPYAIERAVGSAVAPIADICDQPQAEANACLIAAAPDLLSALSCLLAMCVRQHDFNDDGDGKMFERAQEAINKATGAA